MPFVIPNKAARVPKAPSPEDLAKIVPEEPKTGLSIIKKATKLSRWVAICQV
jgi:hypothetical protein